jgi:uncharacterized protein (TIGR04255 family)
VTSDGGARLPIPEFDSPPVVEVALGVQFRPLFGLRPIELAPLRQRWRSRYPLVQELPPLPPAIETSGLAAVQFSFGPAFQSRLWFLNETQSELVQLQHDRLSVNWRKTAEDLPYPRYPYLRHLFVDRFGDVEGFLSETGLGSIGAITQVEISYINAISDDGPRPAQLEYVLRNWEPLDDHHLGPPEQARAAMVFAVPDIGVPPVRMYVTADPARRPDGKEVIFLTLAVRGAPTGEGADAALQFLDGAHEHIVRSFAELTPTAMHERWERRQ